jgi:hypothetical protein
MKQRMEGNLPIISVIWASLRFISPTSVVIPIVVVAVARGLLIGVPPTAGLWLAA